MWEKLGLFLLLISVSTTNASDVFKNCSQTAFCTELRNVVIEQADQYQADLNSIQIQDNSAVIPLTNSEENLELQITLLEGNKLRVQISELNSNRYKLQDVLETEPKSLSFSTTKTTVNNVVKSVSFFPSEGDYKVVVNSGTPFTVETYHGDQPQVVLNGEKLFLKNKSSKEEFAFKVDFAESSKLYGLFHHASDLVLADTTVNNSDPFRFRNSDFGGYVVNSPGEGLYGAVPVIYGHSAVSTSGIFLHNAAEQWIDISYESGSDPSAYFMVKSGSLDLFVFSGPTPKEVVRQFTNLTGVGHMPQLWTLGYHQSRYSYLTQEDVKDVIANMDANDFPMDAIWLDIDYTDEKKYFTWNPENYSDPVEMQKNISSTNRKLVTILDPHIKVDDEYELYSEAKGKYFIKNKNGTDYQGDCWPGLSSYLDFLNPEVRDYYASWYSYEKFNGSTETLAGVWNDMNEPAVFDDSLEKTVPFDSVHYGNVSHGDVHNIYGYLQTMATHKGLMDRDNGTKRPFILTRSHFAGSQRYAAMWTGDNQAQWDHLEISYPECLTGNLVGMVFCGADIGGFEGNPSEQLLQRWYQAGVWLPFYRGHASEKTDRREPYLFSSEVQAVIRKALKSRYQHIPVWYTLFYEYTITGDPVIRPLFYQYPDVFDYQSQLLLGTNILAAPVLKEDATKLSVYFPGSEEVWYRVDDDLWSTFNGGTTNEFDVTISDSPFFYRAGSIIVRREIEQKSTTDMQNDPYTFYINLDSNNSAEGMLYLDDYTSFEYSTKKSFMYIHLEYTPKNNGIHFRLIDGNNEGFVPTIRRIVIHGQSSTLRQHITSTADGTPLHKIDISNHFQTKKTDKLFIPF